MSHVLRTHFPPSVTNATYATYLRCHDDIGWAVTDEDAAAVGVSGYGHRAFLSDFYEGGFSGSFAKGALFQVNEQTGDKRISGATASLAGLEKALEESDAEGIELAVDRILMGHALIASYGGIPLLYMGDELALLNDHSYTQVPEHAHDSRWLHRPVMDWTRTARLPDGGATPEGRVFDGIRRILARRAAVPGFHGAVATEVLDTGQKGLFAFARRAPTGPVICVFNFTETWTGLPASWFAGHGAAKMHDLLSDAPVVGPGGSVALPPYARVWVA